MTIFGERLINARKSRGMTQNQLAAAIGSSRSGISGYETEGKEASYDVLRKLVETLNVSSDYLIGMDADEPWGALRHIGASFYNLEADYDNADDAKKEYIDALLSDINELLRVAMTSGDPAVMEACAGMTKAAAQAAILMNRRDGDE